MGKVQTIPERVEWFSDTKSKTCRGVFKPDVGRSFVIGEAINAPVELSSSRSRVGKAYSDDFIVLETRLDLDDYDIQQIPFKFLERKDIENGYKSYKFQAEEPPTQKV